MIEHKEDFEKVADIMQYCITVVIIGKMNCDKLKITCCAVRAVMCTALSNILESKRRKKRMTAYLRIYQKFCMGGE